MHGENGNPEGPVPELVARWDTTYAGALAYAEGATAQDCGALIDGYALAWDQLEAFMYDLHSYDPLGRLAIAEGDRQHYLDFNNVKHLSKALERRFRFARKQAPLAAADLAPALSTVPSVDVGNPAAVKSALYQLKRLAKASRHVRKLDRALRVIGDAELHEE